MGKHVYIIGGGPAGMMAAIAAANAGAKVSIREKNAGPGRKLLTTGNGRCNYSNRDLALEHFHGASPEFIATALAQFDGPHTIDFFRELGIEPYSDERGRYFPASQEATAVFFGLMKEVEHLGVEVITRSEVVSVHKAGRGFAVRERGKACEADAVIVACGGRAAPQLGSGGSGYNIAEDFGHKIAAVRAALVPIELVGPWFHKLQGVRMDAELTISRGGKVVARLSDEVLFANYGISGPLALRASRTLGEEDCEVEMSFLPGRGAEGADDSSGGVMKLLKRRATTLHNRTAGDLLTGLLPAKAGFVFVGQSGIAQEMPCAQLTDAQLSQLARNLTHWTIQVKGLRPFKEAQVTVGGVDTSEISAKTMESKLAPGVFFCGEVMDVDGDSGGYNLQWAWTSGFIAGQCAATASGRR